MRKSSRLGVENLVRKLIDKQLERFGVDYEFVVENPDIGDTPWYSFYSWKQEDYEEFRTWAIPEIKKALHCSTELAEKEFDMVNLMWGLRIEPADL